MKKALKCSKGFTLIELMVVIIIIGVLASISVPIYKQYVNKARASEGQALVGAIASAAKVYYAEHAAMPATYTIASGAADAVLLVDSSQNKYFQAYTFTKTTDPGFTIGTTGLAGSDASGLTVNMTQPASGAPTVSVTGL